MNLESFTVSYLNHNELHRLSMEVVSTIDEFFGEDAFLKKVRDQIATRAVELRRSLDRVSKNSLTDGIRLADEERDDAFRALRAGVEFAKQHFNESTRDAGLKLDAILKTYGRDMLDAGYGEQTTLADALLDALTDPTNAAAIEQAELVEFVARFREKQAAFKELVRRRQESEATSDVPRLRETRAAIHDHLILIESILQFLVATEPAAVEPAIRTLNERVQDITVLSKSRRTRDANAEVEHAELAAEPEEPVAAT